MLCIQLIVLEILRLIVFLLGAQSVTSLVDHLQYFEWHDLGRLVSSLQSCRQHFINDSHYLTVFAQEKLNAVKRDDKKDAAYKERVLCYLLSHAVAWNCVPARRVILSNLRKVTRAVKLEMLLSLLAQSVLSSDHPLLAQDERHTQPAAPTSTLDETRQAIFGYTTLNNPYLAHKGPISSTPTRIKEERRVSFRPGYNQHPADKLQSDKFQELFRIPGKLEGAANRKSEPTDRAIPSPLPSLSRRTTNNQSYIPRKPNGGDPGDDSSDDGYPIRNGISVLGEPFPGKTHRTLDLTLGSHTLIASSNLLTHPPGTAIQILWPDGY
ncbi:hypothetical protein M422DRAFT_272002 [Sphaerobolus stellatus SS14]|uniref:Uncharacterized protein n=1 Tax=Sphaerobolus stellatus (strain SS14) TaxID=990650 RepID=A0A0C9UNK2_SPHS4|nr:hypothetical protein M422DRAFT_272002 [Sphaerobolus stellatus SS14]